MSSKCLIGADPEMFVQRDGEIVPIFDLVGGTKLDPLAMVPGAERYDGYMYQEDGAALEFNIPPTENNERFQQRIDLAMQLLDSRQLAPRKLRVARGVNAIKLNKVQLEHRKAKEIGCLADHWAYGIDLPGFQRKPFSAEQLGDMRYAGGHIHIAYNKAAMPEFAFAQYMDIFVGLPSVAYDKQGGRRPFYGLAGLYRPKPYGIEYRTLSNYWLFQNGDFKQMLANQALKLARYTCDMVMCEEVLSPMYSNIPWNDVAKAIREEDEKLASSLLSYLSPDLDCYGW